MPTPGAAPRKILSRPRLPRAGPRRAGRPARGAFRGRVARPPCDHSSAAGVTRIAQPSKRQVERQHVDARLAEEAQRAALDVLRRRVAHPILGQAARLGDARHLERAASGEMCGSRPLAEAVTRSIGHRARRVLGLQLRRRRPRRARSAPCWSGRGSSRRIGGVVGRIDGLGRVLRVGPALPRAGRGNSGRWLKPGRSAPSRPPCRRARPGCRWPGRETAPGRCR